jgi:outer membrane protein TolC
MTAAEEAVALAEENFKLQQALYQNGAGTILELNNAQVDRTKAKNALVEATISLHLANAQLDRALGR